MSATSESRPARASELRRAAVCAGAGAALFAGCFLLLHAGPLDSYEIVDTPIYRQYGEAMLDGRVPYRDFGLEYPPGALPAFLLPALAPGDDYRAAFELLMVLCGAGAVALMVLALGLAGAPMPRLAAAAALAGVAPLALGSVVLTRFDLWPAFLVAAALAALADGRDRLGLGLIALAAAAKLYPLVLAPLALAYVARHRGGRRAAACLGVFLLVLAACLGPFAVLSPDGLAAALERQTGRPLQLESLGASLLLAAHRAGWYEPTVVSSFGSQNLAGSLPDAVAAAQTALQASAVAGVWLLFALRRSDVGGLLTASAGAVAVLVALGKVLSPQFLIWLVPLVPLAAGRRGAAASALFLGTLVLTRLWFPAGYWELVGLAPGQTWLLLARNLLLVAVAVVLVAASPRSPAPARRR
ncbi:MAG: DUF2029 domain-containing protein [Thermoleophilia bacterium]|nr:DUF2029 domain-containing protein [Thermoleophilia bacterium]